MEIDVEKLKREWAGFTFDTAEFEAKSDDLVGFAAGKCVTPIAPIRPGDKITARSQIHDIYTKTGRSGTMLFIVHRMEFQNQRGEPVSIVDWRMVQQDRGAK
jgi:acyl dehydratase